MYENNEELKKKWIKK